MKNLLRLRRTRRTARRLDDHTLVAWHGTSPLTYPSRRDVI